MKRQVRRTRKSLSYNDAIENSGTKNLRCSTLGCDEIVVVGKSVISVKCATCTAKSVPAPKIPNVTKSKFPRGWKLYKQFVLKDGTVYEFGIEKPKLKGKFDPTDIEKIKKEQKERRKNKPSKKERERIKEEKLLARFNKKKKELQKSTSIKKLDSDVEIIFADVKTSESGSYVAIGDDNVDYTEYINNNKKLEYVYKNSKRIRGKRNSDGSYSWRGTK